MQDIVAATGHRPDKLGGYGSDVFDRLVGLAENFLRTNWTVWGISGMALGWDQAFAQACFNLGIPWTAAIPFVGQESRWPDASRAQYERLLAVAHDVHIVCPGGYSPFKMFTRDEWMVDNCTRVAALWDGSPSGTKRTRTYALNGGVPVTDLWSAYRDG